MEEVEQAMAALVPEWIQKFYEHTVNKKAMDEEYAVNLGRFPVCVVGTARQRLGLSQVYNREDSKEDYCETCTDIASDFFMEYDHDLKQYTTAYIERKRPRYLETLDRFARHLEEGHGWKK